MIRKITTLLFSVFLLLSHNSSYAATGAWKENQNISAQTRLIATFYKNENGETKIIAGLHFKIASGWKIYGPESGGIGLPPSLNFSESKNYLNHQIIWPKAIEQEEKIGKEVLKYSIYQDEVILPIEINVKEASKPTTLILKINYGLCKDICIPASESFELKVDLKQDAQTLDLIQKFYPKDNLGAESAKAPEKDESEEDKSGEGKIENKISTTLISAILLAIFGGAILNIMPCVLPVLSLKLLSIINHSGAKLSKTRFAFFATICGIMICFLTFAIFAGIIKFTGNSLGWGLQFQNPYFLVFLIIILVLFIANLLGFFEISFDQFLATFLNKKINRLEDKKNIFIPNFLSGILAVLLATPCSAPILGSAISFALTQETSVIILMFLAIGFGFALPYFILIIAPKLVYIFPKPGNWMLKVKKIMALFLALTALWLAYVLCVNLSKPHQVANKQEVWQKFDEDELHNLVSQGKVVLIDVTASWCITCKVNKLTVLNDKEIIEKLNSGDIIGMRADISKPDEVVMNFLRKHGRFAIPFNAVYGPKAVDGLLTSELLKKKDLLKIIDKAS